MAKTIQEKQLGQLRMTSTSAESVYSPAANVTGIVLQINICNTTGTAAVYSIYQDDDGSTYSENTALHFEQPIAANTTIQIRGWYPMNNANGNLAAETDTANALTVTVHGSEIT
jgi:hypothetical protein